jgi:hypothetical protein
VTAPDVLGYSTTTGRRRQALASQLLTGIGLPCASPHFFGRSREKINKNREKNTAETRARFHHQTYTWRELRHFTKKIKIIHFLAEDIAKAAEHLASLMWPDTP